MVWAFWNKVEKLDFDKLVPVPVDLSKLIVVVKIMLLKKMYVMKCDMDNKTQNLRWAESFS